MEKLKKNTHFHKNPGQHLNDIFVDTEKLEESNKPKTIKHKRLKTVIIDDFDTQSSNDDSSLSTDDGQDIIHVKKNINDTEIADKMNKGFKTQMDRKKMNEPQKKDFEQDKNLKTKEPTKLLATKSINPKDKIVNSPPYPNNVISIDQIILGFNAHIPIWGGHFTFQKKKFNVTNICTIDNYLFAFWVLKNNNTQFRRTASSARAIKSIKRNN